MQSRTQAISSLEELAQISVSPQRSAPLDREMVERAAQALFEFVFSNSSRLHPWANCDEATKEGFRGEAIAVIESVGSFLSHKAQSGVS